MVINEVLKSMSLNVLLNPYFLGIRRYGCQMLSLMWNGS